MDVALCNLTSVQNTFKVRVVSKCFQNLPKCAKQTSVGRLVILLKMSSTSQTLLERSAQTVGCQSLRPPQSLIIMIHILFSSQTGTAQDLAVQLATNLKHNGFSTTVQSTGVTTLSQLSQMGMVLLLISTTGDGQPPDSLTGLWEELLSSSLRKDLLSIKFSVFCLGDNKYGDNFNITGRKLQKRLMMLGAQEISQRGLGDQQDSSGYRSQYKPWLENVLEYLESNFPKERGNVILESTRNKCEQLGIETIQYLSQQPGRVTYYVQFKTVLRNDPGDVLVIYPKNSDQDVTRMLDYFGLGLDQLIQKQGIKATAQKMFKEYLNLSDTAPFLIFRQMDQFVQDQVLKAKLQQIKSDYRQYHAYVYEYRRNIVEILEDFPVKLTLQYFLEHINLIKPRRYSIASCKENMGLLVRLVEYNITPHRRMRGKLSNGILQEGVGSLWTGYVTKGKFAFDKTDDYFMIGVGTGIAPFIAFVDALEGSQSRMYLNFGNRNQSQFYMKDYINAIRAKHQDGRLILRAAYSRAQTERLHVQQLFKMNSEQISKFFTPGRTKIYICGPYSNFSDNILGSLRQVLGVSSESVKQMKKSKLIVSQCW